MPDHLDEDLGAEQGSADLAISETASDIRDVQKKLERNLFMKDLRDQIVLDVNSHSQLDKPISPEEIEDYLKILFDVGIAEKIRALNVKGMNSAMAFSVEKKIQGALFDCLPKNFLLNNIEAIRAVKRKYQEPTEEKPREPKSLFHWTSDKALRSILKDHGFKASTEVAVKGVGTGSFEEHLGVDGVFVAYGLPYDNPGNQDPNLLVFSEAPLDYPDTLCIYQELSLGYLQTNIQYIPFFDEETFFKAMRKATTPEAQAALLQRYVWTFATLLLLKGIVLPEEVRDCALLDCYELSLRPKPDLFPQMLIVTEDPGFAFEEAQQRWPEFAQKVPIVSSESVQEALEELGEVPKNGRLVDAKFVDAVNAGRIDIEKWRYRPG